jgi:hypothetical protein
MPPSLFLVKTKGCSDNFFSNTWSTTSHNLAIIPYTLWKMNWDLLFSLMTCVGKRKNQKLTCPTKGDIIRILRKTQNSRRMQRSYMEDEF